MSFSSVRDVKASRKRRICDECGHPIEIGEPYRKWAGLFEGEFQNGEAHGDCMIWANRVMCSDDGRLPLRDSDPTDEYELDEDVAANPPPAAVYARLPPDWKAAVDRILGWADGAPQQAEGSAP